jgi:hypothetical protein
VTYGTPTTVKTILNKDPTETDWDTKITLALSKADNWINNELAAMGEIVPLSAPPGMIVDAANDYAAGLVQDETSQPTDQNPLVIQGPIFGAGHLIDVRQNIFTLRAKATLREYIRLTYGLIYISKSGAPAS